MKLKAFFITLYIILNSFICVYGSEFHFDGAEISGEKKSDLLKRYQITKIDEEVKAAGIKMFDINAQGDIEVLMSNYTINIYNSDGEYLYGYAFYANGGLCASYWEENSLAIYMARGGKAKIFQDTIALYDIPPTQMKLFDLDTETVQHYNGAAYIMEYSSDNTYHDSFDSIKITKDNKEIKTIIDVTKTKDLIGKEYVTEPPDKSWVFFDLIFIVVAIILPLLLKQKLKINNNEDWKSNKNSRILKSRSVKTAALFDL